MENESDGKVVYEVRADTSKLDSDLSAADQKIAQASEKTAKKQEDAQKGVVKATKQANSDIAKDTEKTQEALVKTHKSSNDKIKSDNAKAQKEITDTVKKESGKAAEHFKKNADNMSHSGKKAAEEVESSVSGMASSIIGKIGKVAAAAASVKTLVSTMKAAIGEAVSAETYFAKVNTLLSDDADRNAYFNDIKNASRSTGVVVSDLSEAVYSALSASVDEDSAVDFTQSAVKLAKGGFTDTATAVDVLTTAINAYELEASEATRISDILITTQNKGKTTVGELASSMGQTIPIANGAGTAIEDLATQYAIMTKNGVATAESGTQIKAMLNELNAAGTNVSDTLKDLTGKSFKELQNSGMNTAEILNILKTHAEESGQKISDLFGSVEAGSAAFTLVRDGGTDFNKTLEEMRNSAGATEKAYNTMANTTEERFNKLKNNLMIAVEEIGEKLLPLIEDFFDYIEDNSEELGDLIEDVGGALTGLLKIVVEAVKTAWDYKDAIFVCVAALAAFKTALKIYDMVESYRKKVKAAAEATEALNKSTSASKAAAGLAAAGWGALVAVIGLLISKTAEAMQVTKDYNQSIENINKNAQEAVSKVEAENKVLENKIKRYDELRLSAERTAAEETELKDLASDLQDIFGDNITVVDQLTGRYNDLAAALDTYCQKKLMNAQVAAAQQRLEEIYALKSDLEYEYEQLASTMSEEAISDAMASYYYNPFPEQIQAASAAINDFGTIGISPDYVSESDKLRLVQLKKALEDADRQAADAENTYNELNQAMYENNVATDSNTKSTDENSDSKANNTAMTDENADSVKNLAKSYTDVQSALEQTKSKYDILTAATEEANSTGALSVSTLKNIASAYPQLQEQIDKYLAGLIDEQELLKEMSDAYDEDQRNYYKYLLVKSGYAEDFVNSALDGSDIIADYFMENYKIDLKNYKDYISRKQAIQEAFDSYLAGGVSAWWTEENGWSENFQYLKGDAQEAIMDIVNQYKDAMTDLDSWGEQQSTEQFQADFAKIKERTYNTLNADTKSTSTSGSSSGSSNNLSSRSSGSGGQTINITSYIPTMWDDAAKANQKLIAGGVAASLVGDSKSGKLISGLTSNAAAAVQSSSGSTDASLSDVVKAIKGLEQSNSEMQCIVTSILNVDSVALARQVAKGVAAIEKTTGKKVF